MCINIEAQKGTTKTHSTPKNTFVSLFDFSINMFRCYVTLEQTMLWTSIKKTKSIRTYISIQNDLNSFIFNPTSNKYFTCIHTIPQ